MCALIINRWKYYQHKIEIDVTLNMADFTFSHQQREGSPAAQPVQLQGCNPTIRTKIKISKFICVDIDVDWACEAFQWLFSELRKEPELGWSGVACGSYLFYIFSPLFRLSVYCWE